MTRHTQGNTDDRNSKTDQKVSQKIAPLVSAAHGHRGDVGDVVEATVDDKGRAADT